MPTAVTVLRLRRLRVLREHRQLSQADLAILAGTSQPTVSLAERGFATATILEKIARALGVEDPGSLMDVVEMGETGVVRSTPSPPPTGTLYPTRTAEEQEP